MELTGSVQGMIDLMGEGSEVEVTPIVTSGVHIADIVIDGVTIGLYSPTPPDPTEVEVTPIVTSGDHIANIEVNGVTSELYAPKSKIIYSTEEREVGVWIDNKPIYQKTVVSTTTPSQNNWTTIQLNLPSDAVVIKYEAYYRRTPNRTDFIPQYNPTTSNEWLFGSFSNNNFVYKAGSPYLANFLETYITIWYTKTT